MYIENNPLLSDLPLGKTIHYCEQYSPSLLQTLPRTLGRELLGLAPETLPFQGEDILTLYEVSWLNPQGIPQIAIGEVRIPAQSINFIESKSLKLYLNSFNQTRFEHRDQVCKLIEDDLSQRTQKQVKVNLQPIQSFTGKLIVNLKGESIDNENITIDDYTFNPEYLCNAISEIIVEESLVSHLLKSNCLVTEQPDWASLQIKYRGPKINRQALLRYIISYRQHNEFHEQCVERIFCDIMAFCKPSSLTVYARYTRRGGVDINPYRSNSGFYPKNHRLARQ